MNLSEMLADGSLKPFQPHGSQIKDLISSGTNDLDAARQPVAVSHHGIARDTAYDRLRHSRHQRQNSGRIRNRHGARVIGRDKRLYRDIAIQTHGGLTRLESKYKEKARCHIENADAIILLTDLVAHQNAKKVYELARKQDMCLVCSHRSSVSAVERCLTELTSSERERPA